MMFLEMREMNPTAGKSGRVWKSILRFVDFKPFSLSNMTYFYLHCLSTSFKNKKELVWGNFWDYK